MARASGRKTAATGEIGSGMNARFNAGNQDGGCGNTRKVKMSAGIRGKRGQNDNDHRADMHRQKACGARA